MRITKPMKDLCEAVGAKVVRRDGTAYLKYGAHGEAHVTDEIDFRECIQAYKGGHPNFEEAFASYLTAFLAEYLT